MKNLSTFYKVILPAVFVIAVFVPSGLRGAEPLAPVPLYSLRVSIDVERGLLEGEAIIKLASESFVIVGDLEIGSISLDNKPLDIEVTQGRFKAPPGTLRVSYNAFFTGGDGAGPEGGLIADQGVSLTGLWYPALEGLSRFELTAVLPEGYVAVSEADEVSEEGGEYSFRFPYPLPGITLAAGRYTVLEDSYNGIGLYGYFFPEDEELARTYIEYTKRYLAAYEALLGPYPYRRFSVVENVLPTGYSMPTFTLLGRSVVRLPFIVETSLGHEVLHQWFGNYVYGVAAEGNWLEAITTYLSDHWYEEEKGKGWEYRKKILIDYASYVRDASELSLAEFTRRTDGATRAVGYGKGAMVFHMLKELVGEEAFFASLKRLIWDNEFERASWGDVREAFESVSGKDLGWFFTQWVIRKGTADFEVEDVRVEYVLGSPVVTFVVLQPGDTFRFTLPVTVVTDRGELDVRLEVQKAREYFEIPVEGVPSGVVFDRDYDLMRRLSEGEYPAVISRLAGDENRLVVVPEDDDDNDKYSDLIERLKGMGFKAKPEREVKDSDIKGASLLVPGFESPVIKRLYADLGIDGAPGFTLVVRENPLDTTGVVVAVEAGSADEVKAAARKIFRYGKYSYLRFEDGRNVEKRVHETARGLAFDLEEKVRVIRTEKTLSLDEIVDAVKLKTIIYVGESHKDYEDHRVQLGVIRGLHERGVKVAVGMEMFQRPFQGAIDDYLSGAISEREFLVASEYFKRWRMDYALYREIIEYAKAKGIPVVALNLDSEIVRKVSREGLDSLSEEELEKVPEDMDMGDEEYRAMLREVFEEHAMGTGFDDFHQSQILWDETMAHAVDGFLGERPDYTMVVLAGKGHIMYGSGIVKRVYRLNRKPYATLISAERGGLDADVADFVFFADELKPPFTAKLGVMLVKTELGVKVLGFANESVSRAAGVRNGDVIVSIDGERVEDVADVKLSLFDKKPGDRVRVKVLRKRFIFLEKEFEITVAL